MKTSHSSISTKELPFRKLRGIVEVMILTLMTMTMQRKDSRQRTCHLYQSGMRKKCSNASTVWLKMLMIGILVHSMKT